MTIFKRIKAAWTMLTGSGADLGGVTLEAILAKLTHKYSGFSIVSFLTYPTAGPRVERTVVVTLMSPENGDGPQWLEVVRFANVLAGDVSWGPVSE